MEEIILNPNTEPKDVIHFKLADYEIELGKIHADGIDVSHYGIIIKNNFCYSLDGNLKWKYIFEKTITGVSYVKNTPIILYDDKVIGSTRRKDASKPYSSDLYETHAVKFETGELVWKRKIRSYLACSYLSILIATNLRYVFALDMENGKVLWKIKLKIVESLGICDGRFYGFLKDKNAWVGINVQTGKIEKEEEFKDKVVFWANRPILLLKKKIWYFIKEERSYLGKNMTYDHYILKSVDIKQNKTQAYFENDKMGAMIKGPFLVNEKVYALLKDKDNNCELYELNEDASITYKVKIDEFYIVDYCAGKNCLYIAGFHKLLEINLLENSVKTISFDGWIKSININDGYIFVLLNDKERKEEKVVVVK